VLHVQDPILTEAARAAHVNLGAESMEELRRFVAGTPPADRCQPETFVVCGSPGTVLCSIAEREQADVLVVGAHGMSNAARWLFGSNTERVLRHAPMSVVVVPGTWKPARLQTHDLSGIGPVIVAIDFTEPALEAARAAVRVAKLLQTTLTVVHVVPEPRVIERWTPHANRAISDAIHRAETELTTWLANVPIDVPLRMQVTSGDIAESILRLTRSNPGHSPLLVLGRRQQDAGESAPGTVVSRALAGLRVPLLVVSPREGAVET
jgi:nucleotide-binding universal stress UspA family protein